ncbi:uncharacterized protein LOC130935697 isoform X2 [Arachis stenosperma]|uniref:uncharacterized protein LOC130935697 isoform X2 n=1 Tax=Arachis stenosperma TaxID=217475 RepID=UPI0025AD5CA8|nr:uncharacterized protein LOC130935697 isoform X2 [Arachis stenosperma]
MDKARNLRRGAIRFSKPNNNKRPHMNHKQSKGHKLFVLKAAIGGGGDLKFSEKSKKGKVRSLSAVGKALSNCQMGCHVSEKEEQAQTLTHDDPSSSTTTIIATSKKLKLPKNFLNGVQHASVPRKLRSAMKKRSRESMLFDSEKVNHKINGILESPKKDGIKKSKKEENGEEWSQREGVCGPIITKDEEEVAETLYALAGMFPDNGMNENSKQLHEESLLKNTSVLEDLKENANASSEASGIAQQESPCTEISAREVTKISSSHETVHQKHQLDFPKKEEVLMASHSTSPMIDFHSLPVMENRNTNSTHGSELCLAMGLNMYKQPQIAHMERKPDMEFEMAKDVDCKQEQHKLKDRKETGEGLAFWPNLSRVPAANKGPNWLEAAICSSKPSFMETSSSSGKSSEVATQKTWKRCAIHVHISHIIHKLEVLKRGVVVEQQPKLHEFHHQMRSHDEGSKNGVLMEVPNFNGMRNNGVTSSSAPVTCQVENLRNPHQSKNGFLQQQCHYRDIQHAIPTPFAAYGPQKQSFNFLSLSSGSNGLKVDNSYDKIGTRLEALSKLQQVPYFQTLSQQNGLMSIPTTPQSQYASASYLDQLPVSGPQVRLQQPHYYGNPLCGTHYGSSTVSNKQQYQQNFWAVQLAAQGGSAANSNIMRTQYPNSQSGRHEYALSQCAQAILPRSPASLEALGSKITSISAQQQQLIASIQEKWARPSSSPFCK